MCPDESHPWALPKKSVKLRLLLRVHECDESAFAILRDRFEQKEELPPTPVGRGKRKLLCYEEDAHGCLRAGAAVRMRTACADAARTVTRYT